MVRRIVITLLALVLVSAVPLSSVSAGQDKVTVCHKPGTPAEATLEIAASAEAAHLGHGDYQGECHGPESAGCTALNALVPDPQMDPFDYYFEVSGLEFLPGETIHVSTTLAAEASTDPVPPGSPPPTAMYGYVAVTNSTGGVLADNIQFLPAGEHTVSLDYVVVAGDNADGAVVESGTITQYQVLSVDISCTPAP